MTVQIVFVCSSPKLPIKSGFYFSPPATRPSVYFHCEMSSNTGEIERLLDQGDIYDDRRPGWQFNRICYHRIAPKTSKRSLLKRIHQAYSTANAQMNGVLIAHVKEICETAILNNSGGKFYHFHHLYVNG